MSDPNSVLKLIKDKDINFVDLRFTDPRGNGNILLCLQKL